MPFTRQSLNGIRVTTPDHLILDAGVLYRNIDAAAMLSAMDPFAAAIAGATLLGATRDGSEFKSNKTVRQINVDGFRGPVKGMERIDNWAPGLSTNLIEPDENNLLLAFGGADVTVGTAYVQIRPRLFIEDGDFLNNIALFATINGSDQPAVVVIENVLSINNFSLAFKDKNELVLPVEITGHFDPALVEESPNNWQVPCWVGPPTGVMTFSGS